MTTRVLLAEDNEALSPMLGRFLTAQGYEVICAKSGAEALRLLSAQEVSLLVLDLRLPELSGIEVLKQLRRTERGAHLPVIIMTGYYRGEKYSDAARRLGVEYYLEKPFGQQTFLRAIQGALNRKTSSLAEPVTLLAALVDIHYSRKSGLLRFRQGPDVAFSQGVPISFASRSRGEFPAYLVSRGKITPQDRQLFIRSGEDRLFFTQAGLLPYEELVVESRNFLTRILQDSLRLNIGAELIPENLDPELPLVPLQLPELLYEAAVGHALAFGPDSFLSRFGHLYPSRTSWFYRQSNLVTMRQEDIVTLGQINGRRTLKVIVDSRPAKEDAAIFCHFLLSLRLISLHPAPADEEQPDFPLKNLYNRPLEEDQAVEETTENFEELVAELSSSVEMAVGTDRMAAPLSTAEIKFEQQVQRDFAFIKDKNYYELFDMTPGTFAFNTLKLVYFNRTRPYSQERLMELSGTNLEMAQEVLSVFSNAYSTLSKVVSKERYDELLNAETVGLDGKKDEKLQAKVQFQSGKVFLNMGEFANAEKSFQDAYQLEPDSPLHTAYLGWAIYRNPANKGSQAAKEKARGLLSKSLQYGKEAEAYSFRGWMLLDEGRDGLAEGEFQKALKLNFADTLARKGLQQINDRRQAEKKGFFKRIFG